MFARKLEGRLYRSGFERGKASLIELHCDDGTFFKFVLHLKLDGTRTARTIVLAETEEEERKILCRRYLPRGKKIGKSFPKLESGRWRPERCWLDEVAKRRPQKRWMRVKKTRAMSRFKQGVCPRTILSDEMKRLLKIA
ncbi:MAG: hypothetical protein NT108_01850 [Candidatus Kaiserbacteria bacterium]|nr:hypothetical protein [Candidatus Kaiserbacteria bacterium]